MELDALREQITKLLEIECPEKLQELPQLIQNTNNTNNNNNHNNNRNSQLDQLFADWVKTRTKLKEKEED